MSRELPGWFYPWGFFDKPERQGQRAFARPWPAAKCLLHAPPDCGGMYAAQCPPMPPNTRGGSGMATPATGCRERGAGQCVDKRCLLLNGFSNGSGRHHLAGCALARRMARWRGVPSAPVEPGRPGRCCCPSPFPACRRWGLGAKSQERNEVQ